MLGEMKVMDRILDVGKRRHLADATIECYQRWVREFILFNRQGVVESVLGHRDSAFGLICF